MVGSLINKDRVLILRVYNRTRSHLLIHRYRKSRVWTFPALTLRKGTEAFNHINDIVGSVSGEFEILAFTHLISNEYENIPENVRVYTEVYALEYKGKVRPAIPERFNEKYDSSQWIGVDMLKKQKVVNISTTSFLTSAEKDPCLLY